MATHGIDSGWDRIIEDPEFNTFSPDDGVELNILEETEERSVPLGAVARDHNNDGVATVFVVLDGEDTRPATAAEARLMR